MPSYRMTPLRRTPSGTGEHRAADPSAGEGSGSAGSKALARGGLDADLRHAGPRTFRARRSRASRAGPLRANSRTSSAPFLPGEQEMTDVNFTAAAAFDRKLFWEGGDSVRYLVARLKAHRKDDRRPAERAPPQHLARNRCQRFDGRWKARGGQGGGPPDWQNA